MHEGSRDQEKKKSEEGVVDITENLYKYVIRRVDK